MISSFLGGTFPPFLLHYTGMAVRLQPRGKGPPGPPTVPQGKTPAQGTQGTPGTFTLQSDGFYVFTRARTRACINLGRVSKEVGKWRSPGSPGPPGGPASGAGNEQGGRAQPDPAPLALTDRYGTTPFTSQSPAWLRCMYPLGVRIRPFAEIEHMRNPPVPCCSTRSRTSAPE